MMKTLVFVAAAAMGLTACQNDFEEQIEAKDSVIVEFVADSADSRTTVDTSGEKPVFAWGENEAFAVLEQTDALAVATVVTYAKDENGKAKITATFDNNSGKAEYNYVTVYPKGGFVSAEESIEVATLSLPAEQTMTEGSYDPNADLMVSKVVTTAVQPTEAQYLQFTRLAAVAKMSFKGFVDAAEKIESVTFAVAEGVNIAGTFTTDLTNPVEFTTADATNSITVTSAEGASEAYFTLLPTTLEAGATYTVTVITDKKIYKKEATIPEGRSLEFAAGMVTRFGVDLTTATVSDKWVLVKDATTLKEGDVVAIAAKDYDKAMSSKLYSNASETSISARRDATDISKAGNYMFANNNVQCLILVTGTVENTFSFYDETRAKFLVSSNASSRYLINQSYCDANTSFAITIDAETADATIKNIEGDYKNNMIRYYNSSKYFYSGTSANQAICIYRLAGAVGPIPTIAANVTVPTSDVVIAEEGTATPIAIEEVKFNYVGGWNIAVEDNADWLNVSYADGKLSYTSEANADAKRTAIVTITASLESEEPLTWSFNVLQKGAPEEISIAEFVKLSKDENSIYKLTGKVVTLATNATSSGYYLEDESGNRAQITYLYTEDGKAVWGHDDFTIALGDVMTVTTVPMGSKKGGSNTYKSIYKGHYRLSANVGVAADYTGGDVTISVATEQNGSIVVPTDAVVGTMAKCDYATLSYSGGDTATVSFPSENTTSEAREVEVTFTWGMTSVTVAAQQGINPANKLGYELVTDASTLAVGDEVIIVAKNADKAMACPAKTSDTSYKVADIVKTGNVIYDAEKAGALVFTLEDDGDDEATTMALSFTYSDGSTYYLSATSSTGLRLRDSINDSARFTISIENTVAAIASPNKQVYYNSSTGTGFSANTVTNSNVTKDANLVSIYKKQTSK